MSQLQNIKEILGSKLELAGHKVLSHTKLRRGVAVELLPTGSKEERRYLANGAGFIGNMGRAMGARGVQIVKKNNK